MALERHQCLFLYFTHTHTHIFHTGKMAFTHLLIPQKMENNGLSIQVCALFTQWYLFLTKNIFLPLLQHVSFIHKVEAYAVCWSGGNAINLALIYFTSFSCCPGLDDFSQDLRSLTVWSHHTTNPHHTKSRSIGHLVIWRIIAARYFYSPNNKFHSALSQGHPPGADIHILTPILMTVPKIVTFKPDILFFSFSASYNRNTLTYLKFTDTDSLHGSKGFTLHLLRVKVWMRKIITWTEILSCSG